MDIHEYQAKKILSDFGINIPRGGIAYSPENAEFKAREIGGSKWVVKAQVHSGARGKAGGIKLCNTELEVAQAADKLLGRKLITNQIIHFLIFFFYISHIKAKAILIHFFIGFQMP